MNDQKIPVGVVDIAPLQDLEDFAMKDGEHWKLQKIIKSKNVTKKLIGLIFYSKFGLAYRFSSHVSISICRNWHINDSHS